MALGSSNPSGGNKCRQPWPVLRGFQKRVWTSQPALIYLPLRASPLGSHVVGQKNYVVHLDMPTMIGWTTMVGCTRNSARKVSLLSTILALRGLTLESPWDPGLGLGNEVVRGGIFVVKRRSTVEWPSSRFQICIPIFCAVWNLHVKYTLTTN